MSDGTHESTAATRDSRCVMGFLDFLKKDKPAPQFDLDAVQRRIDSPDPFDAPDESPPQPPQDWAQEPSDLSASVDGDTPIAPPRAHTDRRPRNPVPTASMMTTPIKGAEDASGLIQDEGFEDIPIPPPSLQDPDFLQSAADDFAEPEEKVVEKIAEKPVEKTIERVPIQPIQSIELPDFSDEDIASLEVAEPAPVQQAPVKHKQALAEPAQVKPKQEAVAPWNPQPIAKPAPIATPVPKSAPEPESELAVPEEPDGVRPFPGHPAFGSLEPAMFLSSDAYFMISDSIRDARKLMRASDEIIKETILRHEKGDEQLSRVAIDVNAMQESFMQMDASLFEE